MLFRKLLVVGCVPIALVRRNFFAVMHRMVFVGSHFLVVLDQLGFVLLDLSLQSGHRR